MSNYFYIQNDPKSQTHMKKSFENIESEFKMVKWIKTIVGRGACKVNTHAK